MSRLDLAKIARLAHLELTAQELAEFAGQLESVLGHVRSLEAVDTSSVNRLASGAATPLREDDGSEATQVQTSTDLVTLSQGNVGHSFEVPQVVG